MQTAKAQNLKFSGKSRKVPRDFRLYLQDELAERTSRNPNYSLRSFAKFLDISAAALSALLNGKRPITNNMKERIGLKLGLSLEDLKILKARPHGNTKLQTSPELETSFQQITIDTFAIISEPYHYALLELIKTDGFAWDRKWIAQRLKITVSEVNIAIERLERIGLLEKDESGNLFDTTKGFSTDLREGITSQAQRRFQERSLEHAISSVQTVPIEQRDNTSMTMAINKSDLPKAKAHIKEFRRRFCADLEASPNLDEVYQLTISFVPLTNVTTNLKTQSSNKGEK